MNRLSIAGAVLALFLSGSAHAQSPDNILNASYDVSRELFAKVNDVFIAEGSLAMALTDLLDLETLEKAGIDYGVTAPPTPIGYEPYFFSWSDSVGVISTSDHPDEAKKFIAFMATDGGRIRYETTGDLPLDSKVAQQVGWAGGIPGRLDILELARHARPAIFIPNRWDALGPMWDAWGYLIGGDKSAQEALDDAAPDVQSNLDQAWETWEEQE